MCQTNIFPKKIKKKVVFLQAGPLEKVILRNTETGHRYALVIFLHEQSVPFACDIMNAIALYGMNIIVQPKKGSQQVVSLFRDFPFVVIQECLFLT